MATDGCVSKNGPSYVVSGPFRATFSELDAVFKQQRQTVWWFDLSISGGFVRRFTLSRPRRAFTPVNAAT